MKKKLLALCLTLCLGCSLLPSPAFAAGDGQKDSTSRYQYVIDDCSWTEAFAKAKAAGGYLVRIDDKQEYMKILSDIRDKEMTGVEFRIGARRDSDKRDYYWVDANNKTFGEKINADNYWASSEWAAGEPSFRWDVNSEEFVLICFSKDENRWTWNDVADKVYTPGQGKYGYIVEFDSSEDGGFIDIASDAYYSEPVLWAVEKGIASGTTWNTFSPNADCTRGQAVTFLWNAAGKPTPSRTSSPFVDVKSSDYYYNAVLWAVEKGIASGTDATHFSPNKTCNRATAVTFLWRAYGEGKTSDVRYFSDVSNGSWYKDAVNWSVENGVATGTGGTSFSPDKNCTRGQIVTFLYRTMEEGLPESQRPEALPVPSNWSDAYRNLVLNGNYKTAFQYEGVHDCPAWGYGENYFSLYDMDLDGVPELFISNGDTSHLGATDFVLTFSGEQVKYIGNSGGAVFHPGTGYSGLFGEFNPGDWVHGIHYYYKDGDKVLREYLYSYDITTGKTTETNPNADVALIQEGHRQGELMYWKSLRDIKTMGWEAFVSKAGF